VHIYWGDNDGGTTPANWDHDENLGTKPIGTFYQDISSLNATTTYYYRCYAINSQGSDWADATEQFTTSNTPSFPVIEGYTQNTAVPGTSLSLTKPSGVQVGDLLVIIVGSDSNGNGEGFNTIAGWTREVNEGNSTTACYLAFYWRVADGTEGSSVNVPSIASDDLWGYYLRISGADQTDPIDAVGTPYLTTNNQSSHGITQVTTDVGYCLAFYALAFDGGDGYPFSVAGTGWVEQAEIQAGTGWGNASGCWGTKQQTSQGGAGTATVTSSVADGAVGIQFAVKPAP
jgi:hypothetical protein